MFRSDFPYIPDPKNSPCFNKVECQHKQLTKGICRNSCKEYNDYENIKLEAQDEHNEYHIAARYHQLTMEKQERAKRC